MGRLVLNVLLSFAQFERVLIAERTRDKIAAARRNGGLGREKRSRTATPRPRISPKICAVDIYFGPAAPTGKESNWVPTDPKGQFEVLFRLYGPKKELFAKKWKLPDIEEVK